MQDLVYDTALKEQVDKILYKNKEILAPIIYQVCQYCYKTGDAEIIDWFLRKSILAESFHTFTPHLLGVKRFLADSELSPVKLSCHVISIDGSARTKSFIDEWSLPFRINIFRGINARSREFNPHDYKDYRGHLSENPTQPDLGYLGCTLSHYTLWRELSEKSDDLFFVLEDDAFPTPYAHSLLARLAAEVPEDADILLVNGRSVEKLYAGLGENRPYIESDGRLLVSRSRMVQIMNDNYHGLREYNKRKVHWNGTDGYILTRSGVQKLVSFIEKHGIPPFSKSGAGTNIDPILSLLITGKKEFQGKWLGFNPETAEAQGIFSDEPVLNAYVSCYPAVDTRDRFRMGTASEIHQEEKRLSARKLDISNEEIDALRDIALSIEKTSIRKARILMGLARKGRPDGPLINEKLNQYDAILRERRAEAEQK